MPKSSIGMETTRAVKFWGMPKGRWRVMWHGDVGFHRRHATWTQPTISVVLQREDQRGDSISASFAIAQLWALRLGSVWEDTEMVPTEHLGEERELNFPVAAVSHCVAGVPLTGETGSDFLIPFGLFPHHKAHTGAQCLRVIVNGVHVVLPAIEVIRFYFGSSGSLIKRLFSNQFSLDKLRVSDSVSHANSTVKLAPDMPRSSGVDIARIAFSHEAFRAATSVSRSLLAASSDQRGGRQSSYARTELPYSGTACLRVRGLSMATGDGRSRFLVTEILTCSARLPWTSLNVIASLQDKPAVKSADRAESGTESSKAARSIARRVPGDTIEPGEASSKSGLHLQGYARWLRFTDLLNKPVKYTIAEEKEMVNVRSLPAAAFDSTSHGGSSSSDGRRVELFLDDGCDRHPVQSPIKAWSSFFELISALDKEPWVQRTEYVQIPHELHWHYASMPELSDADEVVFPETLGDPASGTTPPMPRRASFVNLTVRNVSLAIISLAPRAVEPRQTIMVWPGVCLEGGRALSTLHDGLKASSSERPLALPLPCSDELTHEAYRTAAVALLRCAREWSRFAA